jgi:hypothetical protein
MSRIDGPPSSATFVPPFGKASIEPGLRSVCRSSQGHDDTPGAVPESPRPITTLGELSVDISVSFVFTPDMAKRSFRACHPSAPVARWLPAGIYVVFGLVVLAVALQRSKPDPIGLIFGCALLLLGFGWPAFQARRVARLLRPFAEPAGSRIVLTDAEYAAESAGSAVSRRWTTFTSVAPVRGFWVLKTESEGPLAFPADALDATQTEVFRSAMREKGLLAGSKS